MDVCPSLTAQFIQKLVTRFELATGGLQNRCSTPELHQRFQLAQQIMEAYHCYVQRFAILADSLKTTKPKSPKRIRAVGLGWWESLLEHQSYHIRFNPYR